MDSALKRFSEAVAARLGRFGVFGAACAAAALVGAVAFGNSAAGTFAVLLACAAWAWMAHRKSGRKAEERPRLRLVSSIGLPGGARVFEIACGSRRVLVGSVGGKMSVLDRFGETSDGDA
jgi:hypothetical protein